MIQQGPVDALFVMTNDGTNTINYVFQEWNGTSWDNLGQPGDPTYTTLSPGQVLAFVVSSNYPKVQLLANASGGSIIDFSASRFYVRTAGGALPMLSL
jgi:hypothetical protein